MAKPLSNPLPLKRPPARALPSSHSVTAEPDQLASYMQQLVPTEADLLTVATGKCVVRLRSDWPDILGDLFSLGRVRFLTAGSGAFVERYGGYPLPEFSGSMAALFDETMELQHDFTQWGRAFAVFPFPRGNAGAPECGLHFFDRRGTAMHRIFLSSSGPAEALERIAEEYSGNGAVEPDDENASSPASPAIPNHIHPTGSRLVRRVESYEIVRGLHNCHQERALARISIGTTGSMHTYRGVLREIHSNGLWICAMDGDTTLYIRDAEIKETWIVRSETEDGESLLLTAFAANGRAVVTLCAEEYGSIRSSWRWNHLLEGLPDI